METARIGIGIWLALLCHSAAHAQTDVLIEVELSRKAGGSPVYQRAILTKPAGPSDTALLIFRGIPGYALIHSVNDKMRNIPPFMRITQRLFYEAGVALVVMDCPTDQWGAPGFFPTNCVDNYRSSTTHADDVRGVIAKLKSEHGLSKIYLIGHSMGAISSRWLAVHLGTEISGSIHSAAVNVPSPKGYGDSARRIPYASIAAPVMHLHNQDDACRGTPYSIVKGYAGDKLVTVRGGTPDGDPCGGGHLHSYQGREEVAVKAIISWIKTGKTDQMVGE